jgi:hypothetical protein
VRELHATAGELDHTLGLGLTKRLHGFCPIPTGRGEHIDRRPSRTGREKQHLARLGRQTRQALAE